jgi:acetyl-CoA carboxylase carboxyl transferase subunit beta
MAWFKKQKGAEPDVPKRSKVAEGMWLKCSAHTNITQD